MRSSWKSFAVIVAKLCLSRGSFLDAGNIFSLSSTIMKYIKAQMMQYKGSYDVHCREHEGRHHDTFDSSGYPKVYTVERIQFLPPSMDLDAMKNHHILICRLELMRIAK